MAAQPLAVLLRPLGLGDFLTAIPAYRAIARSLPEHRIVLAAPPELTPLVEFVGGITALEPTAPLLPLSAALHGADAAFDLHGRGPASQRILLAARPGRLISFQHADVAQTAGGAQWIDREHEVTRWCRMLATAGIDADPQDLDLHLLADAVPRRSSGTLVHPSAASEARRWPIERWAEVARRERVAGRTVTITGTAEERPRALEIAARADVPAQCVVAGRTDLRELTALVAGADRVVCGDTGVAHLATALRIPSVVLFGPMSPALWGPPPDRAEHRVLWSGRSGDPHASTIDAGLLDISVAAVVAELDALSRGLSTAGAAQKN